MDWTASADSTVLGQVVERRPDGSNVKPPCPLQCSERAFPEAMDRKTSRFALRRRNAQKEESVSNASGSQKTEKQRNSDIEGGSIDEENRSKLASMSPEEIVEAKRELKSRLPSQTLDFLARRGARKSNTFLPPSEPPAETHKTSHSTSAAHQPLGSDNLKAPLPTGLSGKSSPITAQLRFNLQGVVVGIVSQEEWDNNLSPEQRALERDSLRQEERDETSHGYTIEEWSILSKSQFMGHRAMAMKGLCTLMMKARPSVLNLKSDWTYQKCTIDIPKNIEHDGEPLWENIWRLALSDIDVGLIALDALKCGTSSVVLGAVKLLVALCGMPSAEESVYAACDDNPVGGWPLIAMVPIDRPGPTGVWEEYAPGDEETQAKKSSRSLLRRLVHLGLLDSISSLIERGTLTNLPALILPILLACGRSGIVVSKSVASLKPIMDACKAMLDPYPVGKGSKMKLETSYQTLKAVRVLAQTGQEVLDAMKAQGLLQVGGQYLYSLWMGDTPDFDGVNESRLFLALKVESLRIWRVCCMEGVLIPSIHDVFPCICKELSPPVNQDSEKQQGPQEKLMQRYVLSKEIYLTLAFGLLQPVGSSSTTLSSVLITECGSLLSEAQLWLDEASLNEVATIWQAKSQLDENTLSVNEPILPFPLSDIGSAALGAICAVMSFLTAYWSANPDPCDQLWASQSVDCLVDMVLRRIDLAHIQNGLKRQMNMMLCLNQRSKVSGSLVVNILWVAQQTGNIVKIFPLISRLLNDVHIILSTQGIVGTGLPLSLDESMICQLQSWTYLSKLMASVVQGAVMSKGCIPANTLTPVLLQAADLGVHLLSILPPGFEPWGLQALTSITDMSCMESILQLGLGKVEKVLDANPSLRNDVEIYYSEAGPEKLTNRVLANSLLESYAVSWLSLLSADKIGGGTAIKASNPAHKVSPGYEPCSFGPSGGSRLPLPRGWPIMEAFGVPGPCPVLTSTQNPVAGALLFVLGLEVSRSNALAMVPPGLKVRNLLQLVYLTQIDELCPGKLGRQEVWQDDWVRRGLAALIETYWSEMQENRQVLSKYVHKQFVSRFIDIFASSSYGDPLFGSHVAMLLQGGGREDVVKWVWEGLYESAALEHFPSIDSWVGGRMAYQEVVVTRETFKYIESVLDSPGLEKAQKLWIREYLAGLRVAG